MATHKYRLNPETLQFEKISGKFFSFTFKSLVTKFLVYIVGTICLYLLSSFFIINPREKFLAKENEFLTNSLKKMNSRILANETKLAELQQKDDNVYRALFMADPVPSSVRTAGIGGSEIAGNLLKSTEQRKFMKETNFMLNKLERQLRIQEYSYNELFALLEKRKEKMAHLPAIQPVAAKDLNCPPYGFGPRIDPVYQTPAFHNGMDFSSPQGTPVYATADGVVFRADYCTSGYGKHIRIDHGFDYSTLYGHLSEILVKPGDKVKRGQKIGLVGNTGKSVGPHLHYEVKVKDVAVNPIDYFFNDLTPEEYEELVKVVDQVKTSLD